MVLPCVTGWNLLNIVGQMLNRCRGAKKKEQIYFSIILFVMMTAAFLVIFWLFLRCMYIIYTVFIFIVYILYLFILKVVGLSSQSSLWVFNNYLWWDYKFWALNVINWKKKKKKQKSVATSHTYQKFAVGVPLGLTCICNIFELLDCSTSQHKSTVFLWGFSSLSLMECEMSHFWNQHSIVV